MKEINRLIAEKVMGWKWAVDECESPLFRRIFSSNCLVGCKLRIKIMDLPKIETRNGNNVYYQRKCEKFDPRKK